MKEVFGLLSVFLSIVGFIPYLFDVLRGKTRPHIFSWIIWTSSTILVFIAQIQKGAGAGAWSTGAAGIFCLLITIATIKRGTKNITSFDKILFGLSIISLIPWLLTKDPTLSVVILTAVNLSGSFLTFKKTIKHPGTESLILYAASSMRHFLSLLALQNLNLATYLFPLCILFANLTMVIIISFPNLFSKNR